MVTPALPQRHAVKRGECLSSIAEEYGFAPEKIWNHAENSKLKKERKDEHVLCPDDSLFIPEKELGEESGATEATHRFVRKGIPAKLRLRLIDDDDAPRADLAYRLDLDGTVIEESTDGGGWLEHNIHPGIDKATLVIEGWPALTLLLGDLDPIDEFRGIQGRLRNLGFSCGRLDGKPGPRTEAALKQFQKQYDLDVTGEVDDQTRDKLKELHQS